MNIYVNVLSELSILYYLQILFYDYLHNIKISREHKDEATMRSEFIVPRKLLNYTQIKKKRFFLSIKTSLLMTISSAFLIFRAIVTGSNCRRVAVTVSKIHTPVQLFLLILYRPYTTMIRTESQDIRIYYIIKIKYRRKRSNIYTRSYIK